jgi:3-methyladenine DNA glycosylase AlkD
MDLLDRMCREVTPEFVPLFEHLVTTKSWWDTVDGLASHAVGNLFQRFPEIRDEHINRWRKSDDFWLRRVTLLFQLSYKTELDEALLFSLILENKESDEFFIQKAIGWVLREYSKTNATAVTNFVNNQQLAPLSQREALKWLNRKTYS